MSNPEAEHGHPDHSAGSHTHSHNHASHAELPPRAQVHPHEHAGHAAPPPHAHAHPNDHAGHTDPPPPNHAHSDNPASHGDTPPHAHAHPHDHTVRADPPPHTHAHSDNPASHGDLPPHAHAHAHDHAQQKLPSDLALRVAALESLLIEKGLVDPAALDALVDTYEHKIGPRNGAKVVARAWKDPAYKARLLSDATAAIAELGFTGMQGEHMVAVENTPTVHNLVVCTLCSCYPYTVLGLPPVWYKSAPYRSRAVIDPRGVLREFGVELPAETEIRVWDSTAEIRYLVLPQRPSGTDHLDEDQLAALVTRDAMIGVAPL